MNKMRKWFLKVGGICDVISVRILNLWYNNSCSIWILKLKVGGRFGVWCVILKLYSWMNSRIMGVFVSQSGLLNSCYYNEIQESCGIVVTILWFRAIGSRADIILVLDVFLGVIISVLGFLKLWYCGISKLWYCLKFRIAVIQWAY